VIFNYIHFSWLVSSLYPWKIQTFHCLVTFAHSSSQSNCILLSIRWAPHAPQTPFASILNQLQRPSLLNHWFHSNNNSWLVKDAKNSLSWHASILSLHFVPHGAKVYLKSPSEFLFFLFFNKPLLLKKCSSSFSAMYSFKKQRKNHYGQNTFWKKQKWITPNFTSWEIIQVFF
jgi:hypothetical protein